MVGGALTQSSLPYLSEMNGQENAPWNVVSQVLKRKSSTASHTHGPNMFYVHSQGRLPVVQRTAQMPA